MGTEPNAAAAASAALACTKTVAGVTDGSSTTVPAEVNRT